MTLSAPAISPIEKAAVRNKVVIGTIMPTLKSRFAAHSAKGTVLSKNKIKNASAAYASNP